MALPVWCIDTCVTDGVAAMDHHAVSDIDADVGCAVCPVGFLKENEIFVNGEKEDRRGRKLYEKDLIKINDEVYQICR